MKLKEYLKKLQEFVKDNPEVLEYEVIYAKDDEGNGYQSVNYPPSTIGYFNESEWEFIDVDQFKEYEEYTEAETKLTANAICIN